MRPAVGVLLFSFACAASPRVATVAPPPPPYVVDDGRPLASYPDTAGRPLACADVCARHKIPRCPGAGREGRGALVVRGLADRFVVAYDDRAQYEPRVIDAAYRWDDVPAGSMGVAASVPLAAKVEIDLTCLPVHAGTVTAYDLARLPHSGREPRRCADGPGQLTGVAAKPYTPDFPTRVHVTGPFGCVRDTVTDGGGRFQLDALAPGIYLVEADRESAAEVRVTAAAPASIDLRPLDDELTRRAERREACGCSASDRAMFRDGGGWYLNEYGGDREY